MEEGKHIPKNHLIDYADMFLYIESGRTEEARDKENDLREYGANIREIKETIEGHLAECESCKEFCDGLYETNRLIRKMKLPKAPAGFYEAAFWKIDHSEYFDMKGLESYLKSKAIAEALDIKFEQNEIFDEHMEACSSCKNHYRVRVSLTQALFSEE
ncbi:hypothetical protein KY342_07110 [Candidatus Woesearchaeota archaeon]|nr:hypothetical protein [Candidatus Woesearchaeota archaeon]